jgi:hypothetical protein
MMRANVGGPDLTRPARIAATISAAAAVLVVVIFLAVGRPVLGGALGVGLLLGSINGFAVGRTLAWRVPFAATSILRLVTLALVGGAVGLAFGLSNIWLVILGLGIAQLTLAAVAVREIARR